MNEILEKKINEEKNENSNAKKVKKGKKIWKKVLLILAILAVIGGSSLAFLLYGPYHGFRDWLITTGMTTMTHQWIPRLFYSEETINEVMYNNRVEEINEATDTSAISVVLDEGEENWNEYEKELLTHNDEDKYKMVKITGKGYSGYMVAIFDPSKIHTLVTAKLGTTGQYLKTMAKNNKAIVAINGGMFEDPNYNSNGALPVGVTYSNGKLIRAEYYNDGIGGIIGFDNNDKLVLSTKCTAESAKALGIRDCVTCGPFLIVNGKASTIKGNGGWGTAPRTAIGQRKDGVVLFLVIDGRMPGRQGAQMSDLIEVMQRYGAYNAANLDGGTSSVLIINNEMINDPIDSTGAHKTRFIATGFGLIDE